MSMRLKLSVILCSFRSLHLLVAAQNCYYPNGDLSTTDAPCSSEEGAACCPLNWQCLDNGLCYLDNQKFFGRYTCTDQSWQSSKCPGYCTTNKTDFGAQAVLQCSNHGGQYCCDHNRDENNVCCDQNDDSLFFALPDGKPTASIATLGAPAAATGGSNNNNNFNNNGNNNNNNNNSPAQFTSVADQPTQISTNPQPAPPSSTSSTPNFQPPSSTTSADQVTTTPDTQNQNQVPNRPTTTTAPTSRKTTIIRSSTASTNGLTSVVLLTSIITTAPSPEITTPSNASSSSADNTSSKSNSTPSAAIIGGAVAGGVVALLALSIIIFLCVRRRKRRKQEEYKEATVMRSRSYLADQKRELEWMYKGQEGTDDGSGGSPEIDGREVGVAGASGIGKEGAGGVEARGFRGDSGRRPGEVTRVEGGAATVRGGGTGGGGGNQPPPRNKWEAYELAADGR